MNRYTSKQLDEMDDLAFAISILNERAVKLNYYSPLAKKLAEARHTLETLREGRDTAPKELSLPLHSMEDDPAPDSFPRKSRKARRLKK